MSRLAPEQEQGAPAALNGDRPDGGTERFFDATAGGRQRFVPSRLGQELREETPVAVGGEQLYVYKRGAYRPEGEADLRWRLAERLGETWKRQMADEVVAYLRDTAPRLLDAPPRNRINCANGIYNLDSGALGPHDPNLLWPAQIAAAYDPEATCPAIDQFLAEVLAPELVGLIYEVTGYLVTPDNTLQLAIMLLGGGANGKSTLISVWRALLGGSNSAAVALHRLDEDRFAAAELYGKLANFFADLDSRSLRSSSIFKAITGGDAITGERKFRSAFTFTPYSRLIFSANEPPPTPDSSDAFFRRWLIVPFERNFNENADRRLIERLTTPQELSGLLNRGLAALPKLRAAGGFTETAATARAAARFKIDSDSVAGFLDESCALDPEARTPKPKLFRAYKTWCQDNNRRPLSAIRCNNRIRALHPDLGEITLTGVDHWDGLALRALGGR